MYTHKHTYIYRERVFTDKTTPHPTHPCLKVTLHIRGYLKNLCVYIEQLSNIYKSTK